MSDRTAIDRWLLGFKNRDEVAVEYARLIRARPATPPSTWVNLNAAIIDRWSRSGLLYIKRKAWKIVEAR